MTSSVSNEFSMNIKGKKCDHGRFYYHFSLLLFCFIGENFKIFRLFDNGFHAWTTYEPYCKQTTSSYTDDCFADVKYQAVENVTRKILPLLIPFTTVATTTKTTTTKKPKAAATLAPLNQFKYSTFSPFALYAPTQPTTKYHTATAQFASYYTPSTAKPSFGTLAQFTTAKTTKKSTFAPAFLSIGTQWTTPRSTPPITTKTTNHAIIHNHFFTTTTQRPILAQNLIANLKTTTPSTIVTPPKSSSTTKLNLFDLYLGRLTTKTPERYSIPPLPSHPKRAITSPNPYTARTSTTPASYSQNTYTIPNYFKTKSTTAKPTAQQVQQLFESQVSKITQFLGIQNATFDGNVPTSHKPRVWRYSFSGTKPTVHS